MQHIRTCLDAREEAEIVAINWMLEGQLPEQNLMVGDSITTLSQII